MGFSMPGIFQEGKMKIGDVVTAVIYEDNFATGGVRITGNVVDMVDGFVVIEDEDGLWQALEVDCEVAE
jgi:hypothetical protein